VETAPPNVPEFKPAFAGQTRAPAVHTQTAIQVTTVAEDLHLPWALAFLPDRRMLVTEKHDGKVYIIGLDGKKSAAVEGVPPVDGRDQGGLLDIELGPDFSSSKLVYLSYYEPRKGGNGLAVARARLVDGPTPKLEQLEVVFRMQPTLDSTKHAGGRLIFAPDGTLFVTLGERFKKEGRVQARDLGSDFGKIVRILPDGGIPKDNPFVNRKGARPEIWTLGHRNILAADFDERNRLWVVEMGPQGGDEVNLIEKGKDYGWPTIGYGEEYSGDLFPEWKGNFLIAGLSSQVLVRLVLKDDRVVGEERLLAERGDRIREVVQGPEGAVYVLTDSSDGKLLKLTPARAAP
jgi:glucose/arabinose dehydrogenase